MKKQSKENFLKLLKIKDLTNWKLAWRLTKGMPELKAIFLESFIEAATDYKKHDRIVYPLAREHFFLKDTLLNKISSLLIGYEWESDIDEQTYKFLSIVFFENKIGILSYYWGGKSILHTYEKFSFEIYFDEKDIFPYIKMKLIEIKRYEKNREELINISSDNAICQSNFPIEIYYEKFPKKDSLVLCIDSFSSMK